MSNSHLHQVHHNNHIPWALDGDEPQIAPNTSENKMDEWSSSDNEKTTPSEDDTGQSNLPQSWRFTRNHPSTNILGNVDEGVRTRPRIREDMNVAFTSQIKPRKVDEAILEAEWLNAMHEELDNLLEMRYEN